jgi:hypothetical protein
LLKEVLTEEDLFDDAPDFHRQVKAEYLTLSPTQIIRETTLAPQEFKNKAGYPLRRTQDAATVAWNLATGLYYKTQPKPPWKLSGKRLTRGLASAKVSTPTMENEVAQIEQKELEAHRDEIIADVKKLVEKYRKIFDWDVPDIDQAVADKLIVLEVRKALDELEHKLLG